MKSFIEYLEERRYWGTNAAGVVVLCNEKVLWVKRSELVNEPNTWSIVIGGKIDNNETTLEAAKREFLEETKYSGNVKIEPTPLYIFKDSNFTYTTFVAFVEKEFSLSPFSSKKGEGNWETSDYKWDSPFIKVDRLHFGSKPVIKELKEKYFKN